MAAPRSTVWPLDEHTRGKHEVLKGYLGAWLPILGTTRGRILFIDGFAGPGEYEGGEDGSPIIALRAFAEHSAVPNITAEVIFVFVEKDERRAAHLEKVVDGLRDRLPETCRVDVVCGVFDKQMEQALDHLAAEGSRMAPCLAMIDPFGVSDTPMSVVARLLEQDRCEVFITVMWREINRFKNAEVFPPHLDDLFGTADWRECVSIEDPDARRACFYEIYEGQLRAAGAQHVLHFDLYRGRELIYSIFFATKHHLGSDRMKQAIWSVAPFGDFAFRGDRSGQLGLGIDDTDYRPLRQALRNEFGGRGFVAIEAVRKFVASDKTDYHTGQLRKGALIPMEEAGEIEIDSDRKLAKTYPAGRTRLRFK